ncbi:MAG: BatA domain-containing protein, partial [Isosphaeraceae bacterium]
MEFSMINAGLAAGAALAALPVILHLFMRQTPKHVIFPALRLVRERQKRSKKRLRVKNWLLLLARMAVLALMALALARPRLYSQLPLGDQSVPTALGLVFPVNSADPVAPYGLTPAAARQWIDNLTIRPVNRPLNSAMGQVYPKVVECDRPRHEVYVLTDLARSSWNPEQPAEGLDRVAKAKTTPGGKIATFILRLGSHEINDVAIDAAAPAKNFVTQGESVEIKGQIRAQGAKPASRVVEFYLDGVKKGEKPVEIPPGGQVEVSFATPTRLPEGEVHRGELRLGGTPDPLEFNDKRYITFKVRPAYKVLLI